MAKEFIEVHQPPAFDSAGNACWNIWVNDEMTPIATCDSWENMQKVAAALLAAGYRVYDDSLD